jgi:hypothetical protein
MAITIPFNKLCIVGDELIYVSQAVAGGQEEVIPPHPLHGARVGLVQGKRPSPLRESLLEVRLRIE